MSISSFRAPADRRRRRARGGRRQQASLRPASRRLRAEPLEERALLAANIALGDLNFDGWHNRLLPQDVNGDEHVSPIDALIVINALNNGGPRPLPATQRGGLAAASDDRVRFLDVNNDGFLSPIDALSVINRLNAQAGEIVRIRLVATDTSGNPITLAPIGSNFEIRAFVQDLRDDAQGVFSAFVDMTYDSPLVSVGGAIVHGPDYGNSPSGDAGTPGFVDEVGSGDGLSPLGPQERLLFTIPFRADSAGVAAFTLDPGDDFGHEILVFNSDDPVLESEIEFVNTALAIGSVPEATIDDVSVSEGDTGTTDMVFTVSLSSSPTVPVSIAFTTADDTATAGQDYQSTSGTVNFAIGETSKTITVRVNGDELNEANETLFVNLSGAQGAAISRGQGQGTILDDDSLPNITINDINRNESTAGTVNATFTVSLSAASGRPVMVDFATADGTAVAGVDYTAVNGTLTFDAGETTKTIAVPILSDAIEEGGETFFVNLTNAVNGALADDQGEGTIFDALSERVRVSLRTTDINGVPDDTFDIGDTIIVETVVQDLRTVPLGVFQAFVDMFYDAPLVTLQPPIEFGPDYSNNQRGTTTQPGLIDEAGASDGFTPLGPAPRVLFRARFQATANGVAVFTPDPADDQVFNQTLLFDDDAPVSPDDIEFVGAMVQIGPTPEIIVNDVSAAEGDEAVFTVSLTNSPLLPITVDFTTSDGAAVAGDDYTAVTGTLTFNPGGPTTQTVRVPVLTDAVAEGDETFFLDLSNSVNATIADPQGEAVILGTVSIDSVMVTEGDAGAVDAVFTVLLSGPSDRTVTVNFATADGTARAGEDYTARNGVLTFAPGETSKAIAVSVTGDVTHEADETFLVNLSSPSNVVIDVAQGQGTIVDDDAAPSISIDDVAQNEPRTGRFNTTFTVSLSAASGLPVTVDFTTADGTATTGVDFEAASGTLTFAPGVTTQTIVVAILGDGLAEDDESFFVNLSNAVGATIDDDQGQGTILDPLPHIASVRLNATDVAGLPKTSFLIGDTFFLNVLVDDLRADPQGVFQAYLDVLYTSTLVTLNGPIQFGADYENSRQADVTTPGLLNEAGAADGLIPFGGGERLLFRAPFRATANGVVDFIADPADDQVFNQTLLFDLDTPVDPSEINFISTAIQIGPTPQITIEDVTAVEGGVASFTVRLSNSTFLPVTVDFATADGTALAGLDYTAASGTLTIPARELTATFQVPVLTDELEEPDETFSVTLTNPTNATIARTRSIATILATPPTASINNVTVAEGNSGTTNAVFTVSLTAASNRTITVDFATANGTATAGLDYEATTGRVTFAPGVTEQTLIIPVLGDLIDEPDETFFVNLTNATSAFIGDGQGVGTIIDDELAPSSVSGFVYIDSNNNGFKDDSERGIPGVFVRMTGSGLGGPVNREVTTQADGSYTFGNLLPGSYVVTETQPGFFTDGKDSLGTLGGVVTANDQYAVTIPGEGTHGRAYNFGELGLRAPFLTKRLFLTSTPPDGVLNTVNLSAGDLWFSFDVGFTFLSARAVSNTGRPVVMTLYDKDLRPIATSNIGIEAMLQQPGVLGQAFFLRIGGGSESASIEINASRDPLPPPTPTLPPPFTPFSAAAGVQAVDEAMSDRDFLRALRR